MEADYELYQRLLVALGIGVVIGVERGWRSRGSETGLRRAGLRTFTILGLLGGVIGYLSLLAGNAVIIVGFAGVALLVGLGYWAGFRRESDLGLTSEVAALATFGLGLLAVRGDMVLAASVAVVMTAILGTKALSHQWLQRIEDFELMAGIKLLLVSVVLLPLLPDKGYGPGGVLNPYELWWMVVLISGISFVGYFALRIGGARRGSLWLGLFGGLASSTALTLTSARIAGRAPRYAPQMAAAIAMATGVMFIRTLVIASFLQADMFSGLGPVLIPAGLAAAVTSGYLSRRGVQDNGEPIDIGPPGELAPAIRFGAVLAAVMVLAHYARTAFGTGGLLALAATTGLVDIDAVTISMARIAEAPSTDLGLPGVSVLAILIAATVNTLVKLGLALFFARRHLAPWVGLLLLATFVAGALGYVAAAAFWPNASAISS